MGTKRSTTADSQQQEVDRNYEAFMKVLPNLIKSDAGRTALMRDGEVIMCFDTERDAIEAGRRFFEERRFSIQKVRSRPVDLGYFSHFGAPRGKTSYRFVGAGDGALGLPVPHKSMLDFLVPIRYGARHGVPEPSHP